MTAFGLLLLTVATAGIALDTASGDSAVWPLYALAVFIGIGQSYASPAYGPMLAAAVTVEELPRAMALNASVWQFGTIAGPIAAGLLHILGRARAVRRRGGRRGRGRGRRAARAGVHRAGAPDRRAALGDPRTMRSRAFASSSARPRCSARCRSISSPCCWAARPRCCRSSRRRCCTSARSATGCCAPPRASGAVVVALALAARPLNSRVGPSLFLAVAAFGAFTIVFALSSSYLLSLAALAALAAADMVSVFIRSTLSPLLTPPELRGRVAAVERIFIGGSNELGAFESGVAAALIGAVPAVAIGGFLAIVAAGFWAWRFPQLRGIDRFEDADGAQRPAGAPATAGAGRRMRTMTTISASARNTAEPVSAVATPCASSA